MIDIATLKMLSMLDVLAGSSENGFIAFSEIKDTISPDDEISEVIYDDSKQEKYGKEIAYPVVMDLDISDKTGACEIVDTFDHYVDKSGESCIVRVVFPKNEDPYILVIANGKDTQEAIIIEDGAWSFMS